MPRDIIASIENHRTSANDNQIAFLAEALNVEMGDLSEKAEESLRSPVASPYGTPTRGDVGGLGGLRFRPGQNCSIFFHQYRSQSGDRQPTENWLLTVGMRGGHEQIQVE